MEHEFQVSLDLKKQEFVRLDKPVEDENVQKPQEIILEAVIADPELNKLTVRALADKLGVSTKQVHIFRQRFKKGVVPNSKSRT
jgi:hypothetical protein